MIIIHLVDKFPADEMGPEDSLICKECGDQVKGKSATDDRDYYDAPPLGYRACNEISSVKKRKKKAS